MSRRPLLTIGVLVALIKVIEFAIDSTAAFCSDSGAYVLNGLRIAFIPERSYVYGYLIRIFAVPFVSLRAIVAMQETMGGVTAWLLGYTLLRYFRVRPWIAILAALVFACDPAQIMDEHMVMTETAAMLTMALFLLMACAYFESPEAWRLAALSLIGVVLVSLRIVYLPPVLISAAVLPVGAYFYSAAWPRIRRSQALAVALAVSCGSTIIFQMGYRDLTGRLAGREPAYHYATGFFLVSAVAPLVQATDADDPRVARAVAEQNASALPLSSGPRPLQLWRSQGFVVRIKTAFNGDTRAANEAAGRLARVAIVHNPAGFVKLGILNYLDYWKHLRHLRWALPWEIGTVEGSELLPYDTSVISSTFGVDVSKNPLLETPSRRFYIWARGWLVFLLVSPFVAGVGLWIRPRDNSMASRVATLFFIWNWVLLAAACLGAVESVYRYIHPFSFTGVAGAAFLVEKLCRRRSAAAESS